MARVRSCRRGALPRTRKMSPRRTVPATLFNPLPAPEASEKTLKFLPIFYCPAHCTAQYKPMHIPSNPRSGHRRPPAPEPGHEREAFPAWGRRGACKPLRPGGPGEPDGRVPVHTREQGRQERAGVRSPAQFPSACRGLPQAFSAGFVAFPASFQISLPGDRCRGKSIACRNFKRRRIDALAEGSRANEACPSAMLADRRASFGFRTAKGRNRGCRREPSRSSRHKST